MTRQFIKHFFTFISLITDHSCEFATNKSNLKLAKKHILIYAWIIVTGAQLIVNIPAYSKTIRLDQVDLSGKHYAYLYQWSDPEIKPKAIIIAIHGITMHGTTYEHLAYHLAEDGAIVFAPDLPGSGRRREIDSISFLKAQEDLTDIIQSVRNTYKNLPVICLGESLGANLALSVAQSNPELVDGIILSSPALARRINITPKIVAASMNMAVGLLKTDTMVDLSPYVRNYASEDPVIIQTMLNDPLIHRQIKCHELWDSCNAMKSVYKQAKLISKTTPVLIIQGSQDKILKADAVIKLVSKLQSDDQTVKWFSDRGHMLLEECQPKPDVLQTIDDWFRTHIDKSLVETKSNETLPVTSSLPPHSEILNNSRSN